MKIAAAKSKKHPKADNASNTVEQKVYLKPKKMGSEIDEIFAGKKRKRQENEKEKKGPDGKPTKEVTANARLLDRKKGTSSKSRSFKENSSAVCTSERRKKTADGYSVFTEEELGIGKPSAGGTPLCPFDCGCCF